MMNGKEFTHSSKDSNSFEFLNCHVKLSFEIATDLRVWNLGKVVGQRREGREANAQRSTEDAEGDHIVQQQCATN